MKYLSIDIETTGLDPHDHQILEFAAVLENTLGTPIEVDELPYFHCFVLPPYHGTNTLSGLPRTANFRMGTDYSGTPFALSLNVGILKIISRYMEFPNEFPNERFLHPNDVGADFSQWLIDQNVIGPVLTKNKSIVCAGKNFAGFDARFINNWLPNFPKMAHRTIDPAMLYMDFRLDEIPPSLDTCLERAGIQSLVTHRALDDARDVIKVLRKKY